MNYNLHGIVLSFLSTECKQSSKYWIMDQREHPSDKLQTRSESNVTRTFDSINIPISSSFDAEECTSLNQKMVPWNDYKGQIL